MALLLDTHALIWWYFDNPKLSALARDELAETRDAIFVSAATAWEIATKVRIGKMPEGRALAENFVTHLQMAGFQPLSVSVEHARLAGALPSPHKDPFDRIIAAQAQVENLPVVTCDPAFQGLGVRILW